MRIDISNSLRHPLDDADIVTRIIWALVGRPVAAMAKSMGIGPKLFELLAAVLALGTAVFWWYGWQGAGLLLAFGAFVAYSVSVDEHLPPLSLRFTILVLLMLGWMAWVDGLGEYGEPLEPVFAITLVGTIIIAKAFRILLQAAFKRKYDFELHRWQSVDRFAALFLGSPRVDWAILLICWLTGNPLLGIVLVALWTLVSLLWDMVRVAMANDMRRRGRDVRKSLS